MTRGQWWQALGASDIEPMLWHRRWWRYRYPFPHVRAVNVFRPRKYLELEAAFASWLDSSGGGTELDDHDLQGTTVTDGFEGPLRLFASPGWHQLLRSALKVSVTQHVNLGLHHHRPHSSPGFPHTDLNPGWFPADPGPVVLADPGRVAYTSGGIHDSSVKAVRVHRAVAVLFYLNNPPWEREHENCTGLYRGARDEMAEPVVAVEPHSNSLLAFECTPWSFHGFVSGGTVARNTVVQWLHRAPASTNARWGSGVVSDYSGAPL